MTNMTQKGDSLILTSMGSDSTVLDLASGEGGRSLQYASVAFRVAAVDRNLRNLGSLEKRKQQKSITNVISLNAQAAHLPFRDRVFDIVFVHPPDSNQFTQSEFEELFRVLKPGGEVCLAVKNHFSLAPGLRFSNRLKKAGFEDLRRFAPIPDYERMVYLFDLTRPAAFPPLDRLRWVGFFYRLGILHHFCPHLILIARKKGRG